MAADYSKILLDESEMPTQWCNVVPDLPTPPPPPLHPGTQEPIDPFVPPSFRPGPPKHS